MTKEAMKTMRTPLTFLNETIRRATRLTEQALDGRATRLEAARHLAEAQTRLARVKARIEPLTATDPERKRRLAAIRDRIARFERQLADLSKRLARPRRRQGFGYSPRHTAEPVSFGFPPVSDARPQAHLDGTKSLVVSPYFQIKFQAGDVETVGVNGCRLEDVINAVIDHLEQFEARDLSCDENRLALGHLELAVQALIERRRRREAQGVLGKRERHDSAAPLDGETSS
jgi:hypothetical protein